MTFCHLDSGCEVKVAIKSILKVVLDLGTRKTRVLELPWSNFVIFVNFSLSIFAIFEDFLNWSMPKAPRKFKKSSNTCGKSIEKKKKKIHAQIVLKPISRLVDSVFTRNHHDQYLVQQKMISIKKSAFFLNKWANSIKQQCCQNKKIPKLKIYSIEKVAQK